MSWALDVFVPGIPRPQGSKSHKGNGVMLESSAHVGDWRSTVALAAHEAYKPAPPIPAGEAAVLVVDFVMPRPKSLAKRKPTKPHTSRPDVDKLLRAIGDALTGIVWADDGQCTQSVGSKRYAEPGEGSGARILVGVAPALRACNDVPPRTAADPTEAAP